MGLNVGTSLEGKSSMEVNEYRYADENIIST
jgi:hypothetical protein